MIAPAPLSAGELLATMNEASEKKKKNAMKIIGIGTIVCVVGLVFTFVYENFFMDPNNITFELIMTSMEQLLCCGGPITVLAGVGMLVAVGLDDNQYVSILPIQEPPDGPH